MRAFSSPRQWRNVFVGLATAVGWTACDATSAQDLIKANNVDALNLITSWVGGNVPGATNVAVWDATVTAANSVSLGEAQSWQGIRIATPGGNVTVTGTDTLSLGPSGITLTGRSLTLANPTTFSSNADLTLNTNNEGITFSGTADLGGKTLTVISANESRYLNGTLSSGTLRFTSGAHNGHVQFNAATNGSFTLQATDAAHLIIDNAAVSNNQLDVSLLSTSLLRIGGAFNNATLQIGNLNGTSGAGIRTNFGSAVGVRTLEVNQTTDTTFGGFFLDDSNRQIALTKAGTGTLTLTGTGTYLGGTTVRAGTLKIGGAGLLGGSTYAGAITNDATLHFDSSATQTLSGLMSGSGTLVKSNTGTVILTNNNSFVGAITINGGTMQIGNNTTSGVIGDNATITNNASMVWHRSNSTTVGNAITGTGSLTKLGGATLSLSGSNTYTGPTTVTAGTLALGVSGTTGSLSRDTAIDVAAGATLHWNRSDNDTTISNLLSGAGRFLKSGAGEIAFTGTHTFSGLMDIQSGKLAFSSAASTAGAPSVTVAGGGTLSVGTGFAGGTATIGNLTGAGRVDTAFGGSNDTRTLSVTQTTNGTFSGVMANASAGRLLAFTKAGAGTLTLSGSNTYTGDTLVSAGTLLVNGSINSSSLTTIASGATLGGSGSVGATRIQSGGFHSPGTSPGLQTFTNGLEYQSDGTLIWELFANTSSGRGVAYDGINVTDGALVIDPAAILALDFGTSGSGSAVTWSDPFWETDQSWTVVALSGSVSWNGSLFGSLAVGSDAFGQSLTSVRPAASFRVADVDGNLTLQFVAVPEPATLAIAAAALVSLAPLSRRYRISSRRPSA